jgi:hypothetical protein
MAKIDIEPITSQFASIPAINDRFQQIEDEFYNKVLYRANAEGEDNAMFMDIDMNEYKILNHAAPTDPTDLMRKQDVEDMMGGAISHGSLQDLDADDHPQYLLVASLEDPLTLAGGVYLGEGTDLLNVYREEQFVPTLEGEDVEGSHTYFYQVVQAVQIGKLVQMQGTIVVSAKDVTIDGPLIIRNAISDTHLPSAILGLYGTGHVAYSEGVETLGGPISLRVETGGTDIFLYSVDVDGNSYQLDHTALTGTEFTLVFNFSYMV